MREVDNVSKAPEYSKLGTILCEALLLSWSIMSSICLIVVGIFLPFTKHNYYVCGIKMVFILSARAFQFILLSALVRLMERQLVKFSFGSSFPLWISSIVHCLWEIHKCLQCRQSIKQKSFMSCQKNLYSYVGKPSRPGAEPFFMLFNSFISCFIMSASVRCLCSAVMKPL